MNIEPIDVGLALPILYGAYKGYRKGLFMEAISIAALIAGLVLGFKLLNVSIEYLRPHIGGLLGERSLPYLGFLLVFLPTIFLVNKLGYFFRSALRKTMLGSLDSAAGGLLGGFTWAFGLSMCLYLLVKIGLPIKFSQSKLYAYVQPIAPKVISKASDFVKPGGNLIKNLIDLGTSPQENVGVSE